MVSLLGEAAFAGFPNLPAEQQRSRVERFDKYESSLIAHVSTAAQEAARTAMRAEAQSVAQANPSGPASYAARQGTTKPVRMSVPTFDGKEADSLVFWIREIEIALSAGQIYESSAQVAFALSNLGGRARAWAMARETLSPGYFTSWAFMEQELRSTFLLANVAYRYRSLFLRCKQGKRTLQDYVMELQNLEAVMAGAPLSEDVKVTVFMDGVRPGPYSANYAEMARPLTNLLKKEAEWSWNDEAQQAFEAIKSSLQSAPILALPDDDRPFSVVCDASDFAIGCALLQVDADGRERVVSFQSRQLKAAEKNYPVHDKELLAMKYALVKFRVHLLGSEPFVIYTDYASLRTATSSPHLSQRMARWLSFFAEYNFTVEYKPGKQNVLVDALSRRPDYELAHVAYLESPLYELLREAYAEDGDLADLVTSLKVPEKAVKLTARQRSRLHRYSLADGLLYYQVDESDEPRIVVPNDENLRHRVLYEAHDTPLSGHRGREKTYTSVARNFWWPHMYKWVRTYVQTCETCQRVKPAPSSSAPLMSLPVPADCWRSVSMDFIFELPADTRGHTGILVFVCRLSKMVRLVAVKKSVTAPQAAQLFVDNVFRHHGLPEAFATENALK
uniref:Integrase catalytic domain-containing protein n=1 Tax=Phytophthora ramorum TaxID=164328 RepID=H3GDV1_PHYRM